MKDSSGKTKVVIRRLPPSLTKSDLFLQIEEKFAGRYNWFSFRPGKISQKHQRNSRAYIDFKRPEDVFEFAEFFDGHVFVNEKGAQYKIAVEYAPSPRVPKLSTKKDVREGTIYKEDPDYMEFLKIIAKPAEHLPSAEIQLERREAEQAGSPKETLIVTPLMEYVRQKRAVESGTQGSSVVGKIRRRARAASSGKPGSSNTKRGSEKKKYILKESAKVATQKDKSNFIVVARREDQQATSSRKEISENEAVCGIDESVSGIPVTAGSGKKKFLLLKGKERGVSHVPEGLLQQQGVTPVAGNSPASTVSKENQRNEAGGRLIRSLLLNKEARQGQSSTVVQPQQKIQILSSESGKRPPRPINARLGSNGLASKSEPNSFGSEGEPKEDKFYKKDLQGLVNVSEKQEKRTRNRDRPDRGVWTPLRRSEVSRASDDRLSSSSLSHPIQAVSDSIEGTTIIVHDLSVPLMSQFDIWNHGSKQISNLRGMMVHESAFRIRSYREYQTDFLPLGFPASNEEMKDARRGSRNAEVTAPAIGRNSSAENGSHRPVGRRGAVPIMKDDGSLNMNEGKSSRRGGVSGHGAHEFSFSLVFTEASVGPETIFRFLEYLNLCMAFRKNNTWSLSKDRTDYCRLRSLLKTSYRQIKPRRMVLRSCQL
ncbi:Regulator of nonsense transcripts UPF3 [Morella rubra]|uniref:Regulator of nonsense transcripts UPF3 n=2 Tax=Morella rubra TaxID=262757 RepID=A0A6A1VFC1_9ROSI|nr:Regulator of nonsense transcripts UPF3 [Morella rubra]